jgi:antitoxin component YwqK of YwqJK toxin-antitoxin module
MSRQLAALAVSMLALSSCSRKPIEVQLRNAKQVDGKWTYLGEPITGLIHDSFKDGKPRVRWELRDGLMHGVIREWRDNGVQSTETHFENGQRHGLNRYWDRNGVLMKEQVYDHDTSLSEKYWPNGDPNAPASSPAPSKP